MTSLGFPLAGWGLQSYSPVQEVGQSFGVCSTLCEVLIVTNAKCVSLIVPQKRSPICSSSEVSWSVQLGKFPLSRQLPNKQHCFPWVCLDACFFSILITYLEAPNNRNPKSPAFMESFQDLKEGLHNKWKGSRNLCMSQILRFIYMHLWYLWVSMAYMYKSTALLYIRYVRQR